MPVAASSRAEILAFPAPPTVVNPLTPLSSASLTSLAKFSSLRSSKGLMFRAFAAALIEPISSPILTPYLHNAFISLASAVLINPKS